MRRGSSRSWVLRGDSSAWIATPGCSNGPRWYWSTPAAACIRPATANSMRCCWGRVSPPGRSTPSCWTWDSHRTSYKTRAAASDSPTTGHWTCDLMSRVGGRRGSGWRGSRRASWNSACGSGAKRARAAGLPRTWSGGVASHRFGQDATLLRQWRRRWVGVEVGGIRQPASSRLCGSPSTMSWFTWNAPWLTRCPGTWHPAVDWLSFRFTPWKTESSSERSGTKTHGWH